MRFLVDANLPPRLVDWLRETGHHADYSADRLGPSASDLVIFEAAQSDGGVIVSKDSDFQALLPSMPPPQLLWVRVGNATNAALIAAFELGLATALADLEAGRRIVEIPAGKTAP